MNHSTGESLQPQHTASSANPPDTEAGGELIFPEQMLPDERQAARLLLRRCGDQAQCLLDELAGRLQVRGVRLSPVAYLRGLIARAAAGSFVPELGPRVAAEREQRQKDAIQRREREAEEQRLAAERATPEYQAKALAQRQKVRQMIDELKARMGTNAVHDTTIGWRFVNKLMKERYGVDSMPETAENVAVDFRIEREAQDRMALASQTKALAAQRSGFFDAEIVPVTLAQKKGDPIVVARDEHPRETSIEALARLKPIVRPDGSVTAGNASGVNDGACALLLASEAAAKAHDLTPRARVVGMAVAGVAPRVMGIGPAPATRKVLGLTGLTLAQIDVIELNEAFAAQGLAVLRDLGIADDDPRVNPNGGAIALGHPLGASGARLVTTAVNQLERSGGRFALCTMCIGVGQGIAIVVERV